jgi:hypothetical protein
VVSVTARQHAGVGRVSAAPGTRLPGGSLLAAARATRDRLGRPIEGPRVARRPLAVVVVGSVASDRDLPIRPRLVPSSRAARRQESALVSYGDPIPTDPEEILAHYLALAELRAEVRQARALSLRASVWSAMTA